MRKFYFVQILKKILVFAYFVISSYFVITSYFVKRETFFKNRAFLRRAKRHENHNRWKIQDYMSFPCSCGVSFQSFNFVQKLWFHFKSLTFEKFIVIWFSIVTKGFLFQNATYQKCNVVELKNALLFIKTFWNFFPYSMMKNSTLQKWVIILKIRKRKFFTE